MPKQTKEQLVQENAVLREDIASLKYSADQRRKEFTTILRGSGRYGYSDFLTWGEIFAEVGALLGKVAVLNEHSDRLFRIVEPVKPQNIELGKTEVSPLI